MHRKWPIACHISDTTYTAAADMRHDPSKGLGYIGAPRGEHMCREMPVPRFSSLRMLHFDHHVATSMRKLYCNIFNPDELSYLRSHTAFSVRSFPLITLFE
eukprot:2652700-Amphidinium_carterae.1